jgi:hypothetical protein
LFLLFLSLLVIFRPLFLTHASSCGSNSWALWCDEVWCPDPHNRSLRIWRLYQFMKRNLHIWSPSGDAPLLHWEPHYPDRVLWNTDSNCQKRKLCSYLHFFLWSLVMRPETHILFSIPPPPNNLWPYSPLRPFTSNQITRDE